MTKKQKEEQRVAELRKQALLASGVQIEGLQQQGASQAAKKVVYGNRKKKGPVNATATASDPATREPSVEPASPTPVQQALVEETPKDGSVKDDWDASGDDEAKEATEGVKDSWDASSDEEEDEPANKSPKGTISLFNADYNVEWCYSGKWCCYETCGPSRHCYQWVCYQSCPAEN